MEKKQTEWERKVEDMTDDRMAKKVCGECDRKVAKGKTKEKMD